MKIQKDIREIKQGHTECFVPVTVKVLVEQPHREVYSTSSRGNIMKGQSKKCSKTVFGGICVNTGAPISGCGNHQALEYCNTVGIHFATRHSFLRFHFCRLYLEEHWHYEISISVSNRWKPIYRYRHC